MPPDPTAGADAPRVRRAVLVVDDEPQVRDFVRTLLTQNGYEVVAASGADEALAAFAAAPARFRLVLSDVQMPGRTGPELAVALRAIDPAIPVLLMSGFAGDRTLGVALPPDVRVLAKPFKMDQLLAAVAAAAGGDA